MYSSNMVSFDCSPGIQQPRFIVCRKLKKKLASCFFHQLFYFFNTSLREGLKKRKKNQWGFWLSPLSMFLFTFTKITLMFLPTPLAVVWVNRLTFSSPPFPSSHLQLFVSLRYRKCCGGHGSLAVYAILFVPFLI